MAAQIDVSLNHKYHTVAKLTEQVSEGTSSMSLVYENAKAGHYNITVVTLAENGSQSQQGFHLNIVRRKATRIIL